MNKKVNRLIKSYRSIQMNNEVQDYIVNNDDRFDDNYIQMVICAYHLVYRAIYTFLQVYYNTNLHLFAFLAK